MKIYANVINIFPKSSLVILAGKWLHENYSINRNSRAFHIIPNVGINIIKFMFEGRIKMLSGQMCISDAPESIHQADRTIYITLLQQEALS